MCDVAASQAERTAALVKQASERIDRDVDVLCGLAVKLRGLAFLDPVEVERLRRIEVVACRYCDTVSEFERRLEIDVTAETDEIEAAYSTLLETLRGADNAET